MCLKRRSLKYDSITSEMEIACITALPLLLAALLAFVPGSFAGMGMLAAFTLLFRYSLNYLDVQPVFSGI